MDELALSERFEFEDFERTVVLSPHLDDAVLSCGGLLDDLSRSDRTTTLTVSVCCGNATDQPALERAPVDADALRGRVRSAAQRRREDVRAMEELGSNYMHLGFADALYRKSSTSGNFIYDSPRGAWEHPSIEDATHIEELFVVLQRVCSQMGRTLLLAPLSIGYHIDHAIAAHVALRLRGDSVDLLLYEDFPYCIDPTIGRDLDDTPHNAADRLGETLDTRLAVEIDPARKVELLELYESQYPVLFATVDDLERTIRERTFRDKSAEFFWTLE